MIELDAAARAVLERHLDEVYRWNARVDLTTVPRDLAWRRHVEDSLRLLEAGVVAGASRVVDVGSGNGFPGLVVAVAAPHLRVTLLESDRRRCGFLLHAVGLARVGNVDVDCRRAEEAGYDPQVRESYDLAVARATAPAAVLCELALPLVRPGGRLAALVGDAAAAARESAAAARTCGGAEPVVVAPGILLIDKVVPTPSRYPRRPGIPRRRPLG